MLVGMRKWKLKSYFFIIIIFFNGTVGVVMSYSQYSTGQVVSASVLATVINSVMQHVTFFFKSR